MTATTSSEAPPPITHRQVLIAFSGLVLALLLAALDSTIVATALPTIVGELGGLDRLAWVVTAYLLAQTVVTPVYGKLGDLYGRKGVLQGAIVLFLAGSALCGLSRNMAQLILFRAVQGLGGGGLVVTTQAAVGDIVSPRERGRYQGIFGAVFGASSIVGPLLGGYFTTNLSWRWIFYINLPLGLIALVVLAATLPPHARRVRHAVDYTGAALLAVVLSAVVILSDVGGSAYAWSSPQSLGLIAVAALALVLFIIVERRAAEPVLPPRLFRDRTFAVTSAVGLVVGFALFGSVTYLPLFLQVVKGTSPTASGLLMVPMMGGTLVTSIVSGQLISRTGRYRRYPIVGTAVMTVGLFLLSRMTAGTSLLAASLMMLVLGLGLGLVMQVLVIAVQNAVAYRDLGVATSGATLFRLIGGSLGTAVLGAIFAARLRVHLVALLPGGAASVPGGRMGGGMSPDVLAALPPALRAAYAQAFTASLGTIFFVAAAIGAAGVLLAWLLPERPLRESVAAAAADAAADAGDAFPMPTDSDATTRLVRGLAVLADRDVQRRHIQAVIARAGVALSPLAAWLLVRLEQDPVLDPYALGATRDLTSEDVRGALSELEEHGWIVAGDGAPPGLEPYELTPAGCELLGRLVAARRERLAELFSEWPAEQRTAVAAQLQSLAHDLVPDVRPAPVARKAAGSP